MGHETPTPNPAPMNPHGKYRVAPRNNWSVKINKLTSKQSNILISKYPGSFVKIEIVDRKKINNYCNLWV